MKFRWRLRNAGFLALPLRANKKAGRLRPALRCNRRGWVLVPAAAITVVMMVAPAPCMAAAMVVAVMDADMHAGANAADVNSDSNLGRGRGRAQKGGGKRRTDQRFHGGFLSWLHKRPRHSPWARGTHA